VLAVVGTFTNEQGVLKALDVSVKKMAKVALKVPGKLYFDVSVGRNGSTNVPPYDFWKDVSTGSFVSTVEAAAADNELDPNHRSRKPWLFGIVGVVAMFWMSFQWSTYSVEQNTEIAKADRFSSQFIMMIGSLTMITLCFVMLAKCQRTAFRGPSDRPETTPEFTVDSSRLFLDLSDSRQESAKLNQVKYFVQKVLQPWPNVIAMLVTKHVLFRFAIALGFMANAFQIACNCFIGMSRILLAMESDGSLALPRPLRFLEGRTGARAMRLALWVYFVASVPIILVYAYFDGVRNGASAAVTVACGYVFVVTAISAAFLPYNRMRYFLLTSELYKHRLLLVVCGLVGAATSGLLALFNLFLPVGVGSFGRVMVVMSVLAVFGFSALLYSRASSPKLDKLLRIVPSEIKPYDVEK
jgi:hypothetical protein